MPLVKDTWHTITFNALSAWTNPIPTLDGFVVDSIDTGASIDVYCVDDTVDGGASAIIHWNAGDGPRSASVQQAGVTVSSSPTMQATVWPGGEVWTSMRRADGAWLYYSKRYEQVQLLADPGELGPLATFIS